MTERGYENGDAGYFRLIGAIVRQAIDDLRLINSNWRAAADAGRDAHNFFYSDRLEYWCSRFGLSASYIRRKIKVCPNETKKEAEIKREGKTYGIHA